MHSLSEVVRMLPYEVRVARDSRSYTLYGRDKDRVVISMGVGVASTPSLLVDLSEYKSVSCLVTRNGMVLYEGMVEIEGLYDGIVHVLGYPPSHIIDLPSQKERE